MGGILDPIIESPEFILARNLCSLFFIVLHVAIVFWVYRDADRRGAMAWFWALAALLFPLAGWVVYLVVRPPELLADARERELEIRAKEVELQRDLTSCPSCHKAVEKEFLLCPYCMKKLRRPCIECGKPLRLNWGVCPYCKTKQ
ncbi:MAG TPA: zinc ribbon domain-containing protein [Coriobacteriia bacterium]|nr:zinc ribbon domain-containing protein [Coriobacteriia bacterium]